VRRDGRLKPGADCMVCIRPETAEISLSPTPLDGFSSIAGTVSFPSFIGNTIRYDVDAAGSSSKSTFKILEIINRCRSAQRSSSALR